METTEKEPLIQLVEEVSYFDDIRSRPLVVVAATADWCKQSLALLAVLDKVAVTYPGIRFLKLDVDANPVLAQSLQLVNLPHMVFYRNGIVIDQHTGSITFLDFSRKLQTLSA